MINYSLKNILARVVFKEFYYYYRLLITYSMYEGIQDIYIYLFPLFTEMIFLKFRKFKTFLGFV